MAATPLTGSSPHTRGARQRLPLKQKCCRDHPRIRGEHVKHLLCAGDKVGSSPHTRGALFTYVTVHIRKWDHPRIRGEHQLTLLVAVLPRGIIPAYAGSTIMNGIYTSERAGSSPHTRGAPAAPGTSAASTRDHPRIRGEHRAQLDVAAVLDGIIPAYAGSTLNDLRNYTAFLNS